MKRFYPVIIIGCLMLVAFAVPKKQSFADDGITNVDTLPVQFIGEDVPLPDGAPTDVWGLDDAWRQKTPTREKICLNGLWGFRPVLSDETIESPPAPGNGWGWCKVPALWPSGRDGNEAVQRFWIAALFAENAARNFNQAWYKRVITVPQTFSGKRIILDFTMLQTHAKAFVNGVYAGELWYPGGEIDITKALVPGQEQEIALLVTARPFNAISQAFTPDRAGAASTSIRNRGITGDLYLTATPSAVRLENAQVITSIHDGAITFVAETAGLANHPCRLRAEVTGCGERKTFFADNLTPEQDGTLRFTAAWKNPKRWDTHTPNNCYTATLTLLDNSGNVLDVFTPIDFGFRDIRIDGRNILLNGTPVHLRVFNNNTMSASADKSCKAAAIEHCKRLKQYGFNAIIASNYDFAAGSVGYLDGLLEACDEEGILVSFSLPHVKDFDHNLRDNEVAERYRKQTQWLIRRVRNHPSVILYAMNHNICGYFGDVNPLKMDGIYEIPERGSGLASNVQDAWWERNRPEARIAADIASSLDPTRPVYQHEGGNFGAMHVSNVYLGWAPRQERSDWLEHWATVGVKPIFFVEWGLPHIANWSSYRGPKFIWSYPVYQSIWASEYAAQFWGDNAYHPGAEAIATLVHEERYWATGEEVAWQQLQAPLRVMENNYHNVLAYFTNDNWRSLRTWGISGLLPWDSGDFWRRINPTPTKPAPGSFENLKRPGIVPDNLRSDGLYVNDVHGDPAAFVPNPVARSFLRWNMPDCAFIGGDDTFTDKMHLYRPSDTFTKTLVILNDRRTRQTVSWKCVLEQNGKTVKTGSGKVAVLPGEQARIPVTFKLPDRTGDYLLNASFTFEGNITQTDTFRLRTVPPLPDIASKDPIMLYDTKGITAQHFDRLGIPYNMITGDYIPTGNPIVIGRESLDENAAGWIKKQADGKRILVMEQSSQPLYNLLGFRIAERGSRLLFTRYPHTITNDLDTEYLHDWTGSSTLLPEHLTDIDEIEMHNPQWQWCELTNTRVWRCGNRNSVASVLIEKPAIGDWRSLIDGEFDLQYSPLIENISSNGRIIFCQLDVSGRTAPDPVADMLTIRIINDLCSPSDTEMQAERRSCIILGDNARKLVSNLGIDTETSGNQHILFVASSREDVPENFHQQIFEGAHALCLGMNEKEIAKWSPIPLEVAFADTFFTRIEHLSPELYGLSNADWAWHGKMSFYAFPVTPDGNQAIRFVRHGKGIIVFWQVPPWMIDEANKPYLRTTKRRANAMAARVLANLGAVTPGFPDNLYLDFPENVDDPYRFFKW